MGKNSEHLQDLFSFFVGPTLIIPPVRCGLGCIIGIVVGVLVFIVVTVLVLRHCKKRSSKLLS